MLVHSYTPYISWREIPQPFERRVELAKDPEKKYLEPNCFGTGLFLAGVLPWDVCIYDGFVNRIFDALDEKGEMEDNSFVKFIRDDQFLEHFVYVKKTMPFEGFHRTGCCGSFDSLKNLEEVQSYFDELFRQGWVGKGEKPSVWTKKFYGFPDKTSQQGFFKAKKLEILAKEIIGKYNPSG